MQARRASPVGQRKVEKQKKSILAAIWECISVSLTHLQHEESLQGAHSSPETGSDCSKRSLTYRDAVWVSMHGTVQLAAPFIRLLPLLATASVLHSGGWWRAMVPLQHCDLLCPAKKVQPSGDLPWDLTMWFCPGSPHHGEKIFKRIHLFPHQLQPYNWVVKWGTVCWHSRIPLAHGYGTQFSRRDWVYQCKSNCWN